MTRPCHNKRLRGVRLPEWPARDRELWQRAVSGGDSLLDHGHAMHWAEPTRRQVAKGWGLYLGFLRDADALDPFASPAERITPDQLRRFIHDRKAAGNADTTIVSRCRDLRMALLAMQPETADTHRWIIRPGGRALADWLPERPAQKPVIDAAVLSAWALEVIASAAGFRTPSAQAEALRDGLILAILAERAPRLRSLAAMEIGANVHLLSGRVHIAFRAEDMKMRNPLGYDLPSHLLAAFGRYLDHARPTLLQGAAHAHLWVDQDGAPMAEPLIARMVMRRSFARFGESFGPHSFRHALATTALNLRPDAPGLASAVLGNSPRVVEQHYARADRLRAGRLYLATLDTARAAARDLAEEAFARR